MAGRRKYFKRAGTPVVAVQLDLDKLDLDTCGFAYHKWGSEQWCRAGDWIVNNGGEGQNRNSSSVSGRSRRPVTSRSNSATGAQARLS
jgi:hypothetical protein